jgi:chromosome segregation ATPase
MLLSDNEALTNQVSRQLAEGKISETFADKVEGSHKRILKLEELLSQAESEKNSQTSEVTKLKLQLDYVKAQHQDERRMLEETSNRVRIELNRYNSEHRRSTDLLQAETRRSESKLVDAMAACASQVNDLKSNIERLEKIIKMKDRMLAGLSSKLDEASSVFAEKVSNLSRLLTEQTHETESLRHANTQLELKLFNMVESRSGPNGEFEDLKSELEKQKSDNMKLRMLSMQFLHRHIESVQ